ncbi:MAG TPA: hypothetical protein VF544_11275 [Pyrinomonadaceae bacterium]|jgi:hypothetical protein
MNATFKSLENKTEFDLYQEIETLIKGNPRAWQSVCALLGLAGGVIAPILGGISDVITWFVHSNSVNSYLHALSIVLCALTLPLLIAGASCLDLLQAKNLKLSPPALQLHD